MDSSLSSSDQEQGKRDYLGTRVDLNTKITASVIL